MSKSSASTQKIKELLHLNKFKPFFPKKDENRIRFPVGSKYKLKEPLKKDLISKILIQHKQTGILQCYFIGGKNNSVFIVAKDLMSIGVCLKNNNFDFIEDLKLFLDFLEKENSKFKILY